MAESANVPVQPTPPLRPEELIPNLLRAHPHLRLVLDRYGLKGCGGELGPAETLAFFARAHGVPLNALLQELQEALAAPAPAGAPAFQPGPADTIYRLFFKGAIVVALTVGVVWGAWLLLRIGYAQSFGANPIFNVNAHGHAMIFGWVGLCVMGFAYQAFPRYRHTELYAPKLAVLSFWLMAAGILLRVVSEPLHAASPFFFYGALTSCGLEFTAAVLFVFVLLKTFSHSGKPYAFYDSYILAALLFFLLQALWDAALLWLTTTASDPVVLAARVSAYQSPLRDLQIHGFATCMILGVSQRLLPTIYGFKPPSERLSRWLCLPLAAAVLCEVAFYVLWKRDYFPLWAGAAYDLSTLIFVGCVTALVLNWKVFKKCPEPDRSVKFLQAAYGWLLISALLLAAQPFYRAWYAQGSALDDSHAYLGAVRHSITVGFITLMILGVAAKIIPTLAGLETRQLSPLWPTFLLVNAGCAMRVIFQVLTDSPALASWAYPLAGSSGVLELTGIAIWGVHHWRIMDGARAAPLPAVDALPASMRLDEFAKVGTVLRIYPQTLEVFLAHGFELLAKPYFRDTLARNISQGQAARFKNVPLEPLLQALREAADGRP